MIGQLTEALNLLFAARRLMTELIAWEIENLKPAVSVLLI